MGADATLRTKTYDTNTTTTVSFTDLVGNTNTTGILITRIDTNKPTVLNVNYNPSIPTSGDVEVTITIDKLIRKPA